MDLKLKALTVELILNGHTEKALELLAKHYNVTLPRIRVGLPKRHRRNALGCYTAKSETIYVRDSDTIKEPSIILHEFYHHLRMSIDKKHKGSERYAREFAKDFIKAYELMTTGEVNNLTR